MIARRILSLAVLAVFVTGCVTTSSRGPYAAQPEEARDPERARALTAKAVRILDDDPEEIEKAEALLREALTADLYHGPAHNNLGVIYLEAGRPYEAAQEFQWAARLMPGHPDPRINLALTFERAGRIDEALATYETALEVYPGHLPTTQALVRCQLRYDRPDKRTDARLSEVALAGESPEWRDWAQMWMVKRGSE